NPTDESRRFGGERACLKSESLGRGSMPKRSALAASWFGALTSRALFAETLWPDEFRRHSIIATLHE
ncbi:MAG TPA: hypothetical protein VK755_01850, partial [Candidatus Acidoferrales bacterium]|nr:hypothetical protein [Candidatus Acidoferrales bacterium]